MGFVPDPLHQVQALALPFHDDRIVVVRQPDLLQLLRQTADGYVVDSQVRQGPGGRFDLGLPPIDHDQAGPVGEARPRLRFRGGLLAAGLVMVEPPGQGLIQGGQIIHSPFTIGATDGEMPVFLLFRGPVLEDHHGGHLITAAGGVGDIVSLDAQGGLLQPQGLGDLVQGLGAQTDIGHA